MGVVAFLLQYRGSLVTSGQYQCTLEVLRVGGNLGSYQEKEWRDKVVCGFRKAQQSFIKRQLPIAKNGLYIIEGSWIRSYVHDEWIFKV